MAGDGQQLARKLVQTVPPLIRTLWQTRERPQLAKLSFFMQNFMDADHLVQERIDHCSFHVATRTAASRCVSTTRGGTTTSSRPTWCEVATCSPSVR